MSVRYFPFQKLVSVAFLVRVSRWSFVLVSRLCALSIANSSPWCSIRCPCLLSSSHVVSIHDSFVLLV